MPEPLIISRPDLILPPGKDYFTTPAMYDPARHRPAFRPIEVAKIFFGMSRSWLDLHLDKGYQVEGRPFSLPRTPAGHQYFRLYDIEVFAHLLAERRVIQAGRLERVITLVKTVAELYDEV